MTTASKQDAEIQAFAAIAGEYCGYLEANPHGDIAAIATDFVRMLSQLINAAVVLPLPFVADVSSPEFPIPTWEGFGELDFYLQVFDPYLDDGLGAGWLPDDILDIYRDVKLGLLVFEAGNPLAAAWEWRFNFDIHWGRHATSALRPLFDIMTGSAEPINENAPRIAGQ